MPTISVKFTEPNGVPTFDVVHSVSVSSIKAINWALNTAESVANLAWGGTDGIVFTPTWTEAGNPQPVLNSANNEFVTLDLGPFDEEKQFHYTVHVRTNNDHFHHDPDVTNEPPP